MVRNIVVFLFAIFFCTFFFFCKGETIGNNTTFFTGNETHCEELERPGWTIDGLRNVTLDKWPWNCLNLRYNNDSLLQAISNTSRNIYEAVEKGYVGFVQYYADKTGAQLGGANERGRSPLWLAVSNQQLTVVKYLIDKLEISNDVAWQFILEAAEQGHVDIIKYFLDEKKVPDPERYVDKSRVLRVAVESGNLALVKYLIDEKGFPVQEADQEWHLVLASGESGNLDLIKYLLYEKNISKTGLSVLGESALHAAAEKDKVEAMRFFVDILNYNPDAASDLGKTPLVVAIQEGKLNAIKYLVEEKNVSQTFQMTHLPNDAIGLAVFSQKPAVLKYLVKLDENSSVVNRDSWLQKVAAEEDMDQLKKLTDEKYYSDYYGRSPYFISSPDDFF